MVLSSSWMSLLPIENTCSCVRLSIFSTRVILLLNSVRSSNFVSFSRPSITSILLNERSEGEIIET